MVINGADRTLLSHNLITGNQLFGLTLIDYCIGAPQDCADPTLAIDPYPDGNRVVGNRFMPSVHTASRPSNAPVLGVPLTPIALRTRFAYARRPRSSRSAR